MGVQEFTDKLKKKEKIESEKVLERKLVKKLKERKGWCLKLLSKHISGLPDRVCLLPGGVLFFAEIKTTGQKTTKIQNFIKEKLRNLGFDVWIIDASWRIDEILKKYE